MAEHNELGKKGEELAVEYLQNHGYSILETNWTFQKAEIDIIAQIDNTLAIIEVKTRSSTAFGLPQDFVKPKKIQLLVKAVDAYVNQKDLDLDIRFDIIAITATVIPAFSDENNKKTFEIEHLTDAFFHF
ncbi:YraN family protein [Flavobacterium adhaerens]|uniref:YraN family protein n=1 Tax=Flavobacterium adhaerens TaxID=3149043 RepID=UPI0032B427DC